jgi:hypothetical protein
MRLIDLRQFWFRIPAWQHPRRILCLKISVEIELESSRKYSSLSRTWCHNDILQKSEKYII